MTLSLREFALALNGKIVSGGVSFAPAGHSDRDQSGRLFLDPSKHNGYRIACLSPRDDPIQVRDDVDLRCGLPRWEPASGREARTFDPAEQAQREREAESLKREREAAAQVKAERGRRIWDEADCDPWSKLPGRYMRLHRGVEPAAETAGHASRFHAAGPWEGLRVPMLLHGFRDIYTNEIVGLHRTRLDPRTAEKTGRRMLGRAAGAAIKLSHDTTVTTGLHIAEGVESALAGMMLGLHPMWALGSVGGIAAFPVLAGIETLTICAETDDGGASQAAIEQAGNRWADAGREVHICRPRVGGDLNDAIREGSCG